MRKVILIILSIAMCLSLSGAVFASYDSNNDNEQKFNEITDDTLIQERIDNGITDDKNFSARSNEPEKIVTDNEGKKYKMYMKSVKYTSQKIKEKKLEYGTETTYVGNVIADLVIQPLTEGGSTVEQYGYDSSGYNAKIYIKETYTFNLFERGAYYYNLYRFESTSGKVQMLDYIPQCSKLTITEHHFGDYYTDKWAYNWAGRNTYLVYGDVSYPSDNIYYTLNPHTIYYFNLTSGGATFVSANSVASFIRGGTTWTSPAVEIRIDKV